MLTVCCSFCRTYVLTIPQIMVAKATSRVCLTVADAKPGTVRLELGFSLDTSQIKPDEEGMTEGNNNDVDQVYVYQRTVVPEETGNYVHSF